MWKLVIEDDEGQRTVVALSREAYGIGRKEGNHIRLTERNVSREHARLRRSNGHGSHFLLEDLQSYNGVYVNGLRVADAQDLQHGDLIQIGDYRIILHDDAIGDVAPEEDLKTTQPTGQFARASLLLERPNRLVMLAGPNPGMEFPLDKDRLTVGRAEDASVSINHTSVSRHHCEILSLGEGRFEIVDKGSSNGVRVNGVDLKRRIIEAGDVIELGDVRLKFVGHGQIFVPGIEDRSPAGGSESREGGSVVPWIILGAVLAAALFLGNQLRHMKKRTQQQAAPTQQEIDQEHLKAAETACPDGRAPIEGCEKALQELDQIAIDSAALRTEGDGSVKDVFKGRLFDTIALRSKDEGLTKEARITLVERAIALLPPNDGRLSNLREQLDDLKRVPAPAVSASATVSPPPASALPPVPRPISVPHPTTTATATAVTTTTTAVKPPTPVRSSHPAKKSLFELAISSDPADESAYKAIMSSKIAGGTADTLEAQAFRDWCKTRALSCYDTARKYLDARTTKQP